MKQKLIRLTTISASLYTLLKGQLQFLAAFYDVVGVGSDDGTGLLKEVEAREGIRCVDVPMHREISIGHDCASLWCLIKFFKKESPFIVHANTPKGSLLAMMAAWITRVPHRVYTVTGLRFETATGVLKWILISMEKVTCWCATKVIPEGEGVKRTLIINKITKKSLKVVLNGNINGVDIQYFSRSTEVMEQMASIKESRTFGYVFVGRMVRDKGINELVRAFNKLYALYPDVRLHLVGNFERELDPVDDDIVQMIEQNKPIIAWGFQSDVRPFLAAADVLTFPSYREGFPNVVLQAGAMGIPAIVTDINGCNEIIREGQNGVIIPSHSEDALFEAMKWMYEHRNDEVKEMAKKARPMVVDRYEQKKVWAALLDEYRNL